MRGPRPAHPSQAQGGALDGAEVGPWGLREARWADLELTASWRQFLGDPTSFLRHLT